MYYLVNYLLKDRRAALLSSLAYSVHPIHIVSSARTGHLALSLFHALVPLTFCLFIRALEFRRRRDIILTGLFLFLMLWLENEKALITFPFLFLLFLVVDRKSWLKNLGISVLMGAIVFGLGSFFIIPALREANYHLLFSEGTLEHSIRFFSLQNLFYFLDRNGTLINGLKDYLPSSLTYNSGMFYLGIFPLILIALVFIYRKRITDNIKYFYFFSGSALAAVWLSSGAYSFFERTRLILKNLFSSPEFIQSEHPNLIFFSILSCGLILLYFLNKRKEEIDPSPGKRIGKLLLFILVTALFFLTKPFIFLRSFIPPYSHIRSPSWFAVLMPCFFVSFALSYLVLIIRKNKKIKGYFSLIYLLLILGIIIDFSPYRKDFSLGQYRPEIVEDLKDTYSYIAKDKDTFRTLSVESYNPLTDMGIIYSEKPSSWAWLNWDSPKHTGEYIFSRLYPLLWDKAGTDEGAGLAGFANIKYIVDCKLYEPSFEESKFFRRVRESKYFSVYENILFKPYVQVHPANANSQIEHSRPSPEKIEIRIKTEEPVRVMISESYYPNWHVYVDGKEEKLLKVNLAFQGVKVEEGEHKIIFRYERPPYFKTGYLITLLTIPVLLAVFFKKEPKEGSADESTSHKSPKGKGIPRSKRRKVRA